MTIEALEAATGLDLPAASVVTVGTAAGWEAPSVVHRGEDGRLLVEALAPARQALMPPALGEEATLAWRRGGGRAAVTARIEDTAGFPLIWLRPLGAAAPVADTLRVRLALAFPVRYQVVPAEPRTMAGRFRARLDARPDGPSPALASEPRELALLGLAKMMTRLDARFDRVLAQLSGTGGGRRDGAAPAEEPHEVLVFSLARLMMTRLDEKFDRLLAALRDPGVLAHPPGREDESGEAAPGAIPQEVLVLHALNRLMESLSEKFERVAGAMDGRGERLRLADAWGLGISEEGLVLGLPAPLAVDAILDLDVRLPLFPPLPLLVFGQVVETSEQPDDVPERRFRARVAFVGLGEADRELLVQLILRKEREMLRARHAGA